MTAEQLDLGSLLKQEGMRRAEDGTDDWWRSTCDQAIREAARTGEEFQSWDLFTRYGLPEPRTTQQLGPRFAKAAADGVIEFVRYDKSKRPNTRRSVLSVWRGRPGAAA